MYIYDLCYVEQGFSILVVLTSWAGSFFAVGASLCITGYLASLVLMSLNASSSPPLVTIKNAYSHGQISSGRKGQNYHQLRTTDMER